MYKLGYLAAAALLITQSMAGPISARITDSYPQSGTYQIVNLMSGTAIDLFMGGNEIYGWPKSVAFLPRGRGLLKLPARNLTRNLKCRDNQFSSQHQVWRLRKKPDGAVYENLYTIQNNGTQGGIWDMGGMNIPPSLLSSPKTSPSIQPSIPICGIYANKRPYRRATSPSQTVPARQSVAAMDNQPSPGV